MDTFVKYFYDTSVEKFGPFKYKPENGVFAFAGIVCHATEDTFYYLDTKDEGEIQKLYVAIDDVTPTVFSHGYIERNGKYDYYIATDQIIGVVFADKLALDGKATSKKTPSGQFWHDKDTKVWVLNSSGSKAEFGVNYGNSYKYQTIKKGD